MVLLAFSNAAVAWVLPLSAAVTEENDEAAVYVSRERKGGTFQVLLLHRFELGVGVF
jgi:hypothetical protein